jgi:poly(3-hydroxybutyrate) depolymerase
MRNVSLILAAALVVTAWPLASSVARAQQPAGKGGAADAAFRAFWDAENPVTAERAAAQVLASGADFDTIWARLRAGRTYTKQPTGVRTLPATLNGVSLDNLVEVPAEYDPGRKWPVRLQLHGGVGRPAPAAGEAARPLNNRIPGPPLIDIHPRAWSGSEWWVSKQVDNIFTLIDRVKRAYNVDESRISITGISDGGTGVYYLAMRAATMWASCLPLNGHPLVLANPDTGADGELFIGNLVNCPMYLVNGGRDRLYPAASVAPLVAMMKVAGVSTVFQVYPDAGHDTSWWPVERPKYEAFLAAHPRSPHPERLSWETERVDRYNRIDWLLISRLGKRPSDARLEDVNTFEPIAGRTAQLYDRSGRSGRVDIVRKGNAFEARTRGVQQFTLLLSPDVMDFGKPVQVTINGTRVFEGAVKRDPAVLLKWAARDDDRA